MINVLIAVTMLTLANVAPEYDQPDKTRGAKSAEAAGQRVEPPCAGPACPVPVPFPSTRTTDAGPGAPASSDLIIIPLCSPPTGGTPKSNGNEAGTSSGHCSKPIGLGPPPDVQH